MRYLLLIIMFFTAMAVQATEAESIGGDDALNAKINVLSKELRCLKCQNQSIADSKSGFANQVRNELRRQFKEGKSENQIKEFLISRYGDFIVYEPPFNLTNSLIWLTPLVILIAGLWVLFRIVSRQQIERPGDNDIDENDSIRLNKLLEENEHTKGKST